MTDWKDNEDVGKDYGPEEEDETESMDYETLLEYVDELLAQEEKLHDRYETIENDMMNLRDKIERLQERLEEMDRDGDGT